MAVMAGHTTTLEVAALSGAGTSLTNYTLSQLGSTQAYRPSYLRRFWDPDSTITIYDDGTPVDADDIELINLNDAVVKFDAGYSVTGPVTADFTYFGTVTIAYARGYTMRLSRDMLDTSRFGTSHRKRLAGLKTASGTLDTVAFVYGDGTYSSIAGRFDAGLPVIISIRTDGDNAQARTIRCRLNEWETSAKVDGLVVDSISWESDTASAADNWNSSIGFGIDFYL